MIVTFIAGGLCLLSMTGLVFMYELLAIKYGRLQDKHIALLKEHLALLRAGEHDPADAWKHGCTSDGD